MNKVIIGLVAGGLGTLIGGTGVYVHWAKKYSDMMNEHADYIHKSNEELKKILEDHDDEEVVEDLTEEESVKKSIERARKDGVPEDKILKSEEDLRHFLES